MTDTPIADVRDAVRMDGLALAAALVTVMLWASAFVGIRDAGAQIAAGPLSLGRLLVGGAVLGAVVATRREALPPRADVPQLVLCGLLWFAAYNVILNSAEHRVDAGTAAMLVNIGPVFIAMLAGLLLREGFPRTLLAGCAIAFAGAIVIGLATRERSVHAGWGAALCIAAAAAYSASSRRSRCSSAPPPCRSRSWRVSSARSRACRTRPRSWATRVARARRRSDGPSTSASSRPRSASRRGRTHCAGRPRGAWARRCTSCRRWRCSWAGRSWARRHRRSPSRAGGCAWPGCSSPAA